MNSGIYISKDEVMRYLGYGNQTVDNSFCHMVDEIIKEVKETINVACVYKVCNVIVEDERLLFTDGNIVIKSKDLCGHLNKSKKCVIMAITIGHGIDRKISYYEKFDMTKAMVFNASANAAVEEAADNLCGEIKKSLGICNLTSRFSPGYGDFSLEYQNEILKFLRAMENAGISISSGNMLIPCKSVTAIVGITKEGPGVSYNKCNSCVNNSKCEFRRVGENCGLERRT